MAVILLNFNAAGCMTILAIYGYKLKKGVVFYDKLILYSNQTKSELKINLTANNYEFVYKRANFLKNLIKEIKQQDQNVTIVSLVEIDKIDDVKCQTYINNTFDVSKISIDLRVLSFYTGKNVHKYRKFEAKVMTNNENIIIDLLKGVKVSKHEKKLLNLK